ncbi:unnamed protein product [Pneumocystis jirovecii]|uniref:Golgi apparatus membrane protein TVP23 n=1 Tax=Pneumocystis jirovecii TaxID=42068 RepID=L0PG04_PNEJI|nr:unnamed protein product [Pneumocystis jirovecii]
MRGQHDIYVEENPYIYKHKFQSIFQLSSHPIALFFFFLFRFLAILTYLFGFLIFHDLYVFYGSFDFWTVKNVSGRLLVGLRWWNETNSEGESIWIFESADPQNKQNVTDSRIFWFILYLVPVIWAVFGIIAFLKFNFLWLIVIIIALLLSGGNALAFTRNEEIRICLLCF